MGEEAEMSMGGRGRREGCGKRDKTRSPYQASSLRPPVPILKPTPRNAQESAGTAPSQQGCPGLQAAGL